MHKYCILNFYMITKINFKNLEETKKKSFIDILFSVLENNPDQMTDLDIREEVDTFLFEGHDTSSIAITMTLILLGMYSDVQVRCVIMKIFFFRY